MTSLGFHLRFLTFVVLQESARLSKNCQRNLSSIQGSEILFYLLAEQIVQKIPLFSGQLMAVVEI